MRFEKDSCENLIVDSLISGGIWRNKDLYPKWFLNQYRKLDSESGLPKPPPKLKLAPRQKPKYDLVLT
jgi:hypothetical protein